MVSRSRLAGHGNVASHLEEVSRNGVPIWCSRTTKFYRAFEICRSEQKEERRSSVSVLLKLSRPPAIDVPHGLQVVILVK